MSHDGLQCGTCSFSFIALRGVLPSFSGRCNPLCSPSDASCIPAGYAVYFLGTVASMACPALIWRLSRQPADVALQQLKLGDFYADDLILRKILRQKKRLAAEAAAAEEIDDVSDDDEAPRRRSQAVKKERRGSDDEIEDDS